MLLGFRSASPSPSPSPSPFSFFSAISKLRRFNPKPRRFNSKFLSPVSSSSLPFAFYLIRCIASGRSAMETSDEGRGKAQEDQRSFTNRLAKEHSPYLLQHAHNPVDWFPWGEQAFEKAQMEDKPIFLSVGYSTCHWCHVMEVESFENEEIAKTMNEWFVNIKVDREERPDVDKVYMTYVQATQGGGGWPMSVFLTPELKPMVGGTYFPPDDKYGRPGFKSILR